MSYGIEKSWRHDKCALIRMRIVFIVTLMDEIIFQFLHSARSFHKKMPYDTICITVTKSFGHQWQKKLGKFRRQDAN